MNPSRDKGSRYEREIVEELRSAGLDAWRVPLSGAQRGWKGDVQIRGAQGNISIECKVRRAGFRSIYEYLAGVTYLVFRQDRDESLVAMTLTCFLDLIATNNKLRDEVKRLDIDQSKVKFLSTTTDDIARYYIEKEKDKVDSKL